MEWRSRQQEMLSEYLVSANNQLQVSHNCHRLLLTSKAKTNKIEYLYINLDTGMVVSRPAEKFKIR